jgi:hypothetical protein
MGARANGMASASACLSDIWSLTNNPAGLAKTKSVAAAFTYHAVPSFTSFNRTSAGIVTPVKWGVAGAGVFRFGDDLYSEQIFSLGLANTFGLASLGLKVNWLQYRAEGLETRTALTLSFGGIATLNSKILVGAHIVNINQPVINDLTEERVPTKLIAGIAYQPSAQLLLAGEVEQAVGHLPFIKAGLEYLIHKKIFFRTGFRLRPATGSFGAGYKTAKFQLDYAVQLNSPSGLSHEASAVCYFIRR